MIFGERKLQFGECFDRSATVEPGRCDESGNRAADYVLQQIPPIAQAAVGRSSVKAKKLTFTRGHAGCAKAVHPARMVRGVAMEPTVEKDFIALFGPQPKAPCEWGARNDARLLPVIGYYKQCQTRLIHLRCKDFPKLVDLGFKTRTDIMNGHDQRACFGLAGQNYFHWK